MVIKLVVALALGLIVGIEREFVGKEAGTKTYSLVTLGAALFTILSFDPNFPDPSRIIAQIITGIGFIGAGAILRPTSGRGSVVGLTTAATLWVVCGLGIAVGMGFYFESIVTTALVFFTFLFLSKIVNKVRVYTKAHPVKYTGEADEEHFDTEETREH